MHHATPHPSAPDEPRTDPVSLDTLRAQSMHDASLALRLLDALARQVERDLADLTRCDPARDAPRIAAIAHALKGAAGAVGALPVMHAARAADDAARAGSSDAHASLATLRDELHRLLDALPHIRRALDPQPPTAPHSPERP